MSCILWCTFNVNWITPIYCAISIKILNWIEKFNVCFFAMHFLLYLWMLNYSYKIFFVISYPFKFQLYIYIYRGCWYKHSYWYSWHIWTEQFYIRIQKQENVFFLNLFPMKNLQIWQQIYMHADLNFKLVRIIYTLREKKMYVSM
jgi:hypothetical protein